MRADRSRPSATIFPVYTGGYRRRDRCCLRGVELVDDRHADYAKLDVRTLVADNSWNAGVVLEQLCPSARFVGEGRSGRISGRRRDRDAALAPTRSATHLNRSRGWPIISPPKASASRKATSS